MENWVVFRLNGKELCAYTLKDTFFGERQATIELLAYENNCKEEEIEIFIEKR